MEIIPIYDCATDELVFSGYDAGCMPLSADPLDYVDTDFRSQYETAGLGNWIPCYASGLIPDSYETRKLIKITPAEWALFPYHIFYPPDPMCEGEASCFVTDAFKDYMTAWLGEHSPIDIPTTSPVSSSGCCS